MSDTSKWIVGVCAVALLWAVPSTWAASAEDLAKESETKCQATAKDKPTPSMIKERVNKAAQLLAQEGDAAIPKFKGKDSEFIFAGTYIWIHNLDGVMLVHPIKFKLDNTNILGMKDAAGKLLFLEMNQLVQEKGEGWYEYQWPKPGEKASVSKVSFVKLVKKGDKSYVVGCGVYDMPMSEVTK